MVRFLVRRAATLAVTLLVVSVLAFLIPYVGEGDPARKILRARLNDPALDPAQVEALTRELGLDRPLYQQYLAWLSDAVRGDFGYSFTSRTPVQELVVPALGVSISLALAALLLALVLALPLGTWAATARGGKVDNTITFISQSSVSAPEYWVGPVLVLIFARVSRLVAVGGLGRAGLHRAAGGDAGAASARLLHPGDQSVDE